MSLAERVATHDGTHVQACTCCRALGSAVAALEARIIALEQVREAAVRYDAESADIIWDDRYAETEVVSRWSTARAALLTALHALN